MPNSMVGHDQVGPGKRHSGKYPDEPAAALSVVTQEEMAAIIDHVYEEYTQSGVAGCGEQPPDRSHHCYGQGMDTLC